MAKKTSPRFLLHFLTIKKNKSGFIIWILISVIFGLIGFWLPILVGPIIQKNLFPIVMGENPFILFSILFLIESGIASINIVGVGSNQFALGIRIISIIVVIIYIVILEVLSILKYTNNATISTSVQFLILIITLLVGIYLYGFRGTEWEKSITDIVQEQDKNVQKDNDKANEINDDGSEVKL